MKNRYDRFCGELSIRHFKSNIVVKSSLLQSPSMTRYWKIVWYKFNLMENLYKKGFKYNNPLFQDQNRYAFLFCCYYCYCCCYYYLNLILYLHRSNRSKRYYGNERNYLRKNLILMFLACPFIYLRT